jgi:hypothetical protein
MSTEDLQTYEHLASHGEAAGRAGDFLDAASAWARAAAVARSVSERATALSKAAPYSGLAGDPRNREIRGLEAAAAWAEVAGSSQTREARLSALWHAFLAGVTARSEEAQLNALDRFIGELKKEPSHENQIRRLEALHLPPVRAAESARRMTAALGDAHFGLARSQRGEDKVRSLRRSRELYKAAGNETGRLAVDAEFARHEKQRGLALEREARRASGLLRAAHLYDKAAAAYRPHWPDDSERCTAMAVRTLRTIDEAARRVRGFFEGERYLDQVLAEMGAGSSDRRGSRWYVPNVGLRVEGAVADSGTIALFDTTFDRPRLMERFTERLFDAWHIPPEDVETRRLLVGVMLRIADVESHSIYPTMMAGYDAAKIQWRRAILALISAAVIGAGAGAAESGHWSEVLARAIDMEASAAVSLAVTRITRSKQEPRGSVTLTQQDNPDDQIVCLRLADRAMTVKELASGVHWSETRVRRTLHRLEGAGVVVRSARRGNADVWELQQL